MKVTKITLLNQRSLSWEFNEFNPVDILTSASKELLLDAKYLEDASKLIGYINQFPDDDIEKSILTFFPGENTFTKKKRGKNKWSYHVHGGLYIHVEE